MPKIGDKSRVRALSEHEERRGKGKFRACYPHSPLFPFPICNAFFLAASHQLMVVIFSGSKDTARAFVNAAAREYIMKMSKAALLPEEVKRFP